MKTLITLGLIASLAAPAAHSTGSGQASSGQAAQTTTSTTTSSTTATTTAAAVDLTGTWDATFTAQQGPIPGQLVFKKDAGKIVGNVTSQVGAAPLEAEVKGKAVTVWFTITMQNGPVAIQLDGTVDGDTIKGSIGAGGQPAGTWVATKSKDTKDTTSATTSTASTTTASAPSLTGTWNVTIELPNMTANPTMNLKQDGEKVTGEYVSAQYGKFPMTGTVKGTDVVMSFQMNLEGTSLNVTYSGKLEKDGTMKGSVNYGDMMSGTFSAALKK
jgi:hypothetical protein